jgi:processive 1,2-diacylglycerol beta-glucosyltransferase
MNDTFRARTRRTRRHATSDTASSAQSLSPAALSERFGGRVSESHAARPLPRAPKVLIFSASAGVGHLRSAQAVELALRELCPDAEVVNVDVLTLTNRLVRHFCSRTYFDLIKAAPHFVGYVYDRLDKPAKPSALDGVKARLQRSHFRRAVELIESRPWDLAINTHFLSAELIGGLRRAGRVSFPQVTVTTDFYIHSMWVKQPVDRYFAASDETAACLSAYVPAEQIEVTGIPVHPAFAEPHDRLACRQKHGLPMDRPMILQLAGGFGVGPIEAIHQGLLAGRRPLHVVVAAGRNEAARQRLQSVPLPAHHSRTILGFTDAMHELMAAADLVVSKPGGLTTSEALASGVPMLVIDPIPGQECRNCDYLLERGAAVKAGTLHTLPFKLDQLLADPRSLQDMAVAARQLGRPRAAFDVVRSALSLVRQTV